MKELIEVIAKSLVDHPESVRVSCFERDRDLVCELTVSPDDTGKIIGKQGRIIKTIRAIVTAAGAAQNKRIFLEIV